ncbi:hypothetical protein Pmani_035126 [Petrolisthes manimaculis]|uniref:Uncharacterized protein n=1 Tax=Petrolisthes manimaculis TaxID=1843537 RepID=A0AAE1NLD3_9EUCA|nr:hypothetical protein Pmani_035126 [Petrolisthes manimaculis]
MLGSGRVRRDITTTTTTTTTDTQHHVPPPAEEVADMLIDTMEANLSGCHKVILFNQHNNNNNNNNTTTTFDFGDVVEALVERVGGGGGDAVVVWDLDTLLTTPTPSHPLLNFVHPMSYAPTDGGGGSGSQDRGVGGGGSSQGGGVGGGSGGSGDFCVAFVVLAGLEKVGTASVALQRGKWYRGATRLLLGYIGSAPDNFMALIATHPLLGHVKGVHLYPDTFKGHTFSIVTLEYAPFTCYDMMGDGEMWVKIMPEKMWVKVTETQQQ